MTVILMLIDAATVVIISGVQTVTGRRGRRSRSEWRQVANAAAVRREMTQTVFDTERALLAELVWHTRYRPSPPAATGQPGDEAAS